MEKVAVKAILDKSLFKKTVQVLSCTVPIKTIGDFQRKFKSCLLKMPAAKTILNVEGNDEQKCVSL